MIDEINASIDNQLLTPNYKWYNIDRSLKITPYLYENLMNNIEKELNLLLKKVNDDKRRIELLDEYYKNSSSFPTFKIFIDDLDITDNTFGVDSVDSVDSVDLLIKNQQKIKVINLNNLIVVNYQKIIFYNDDNNVYEYNFDEAVIFSDIFNIFEENNINLTQINNIKIIINTNYGIFEYKYNLSFYDYSNFYLNLKPLSEYYIDDVKIPLETNIIENIENGDDGINIEDVKLSIFEDSVNTTSESKTEKNYTIQVDKTIDKYVIKTETVINGDVTSVSEITYTKDEFYDVVMKLVRDTEVKNNLENFSYRNNV